MIKNQCRRVEDFLPLIQEFYQEIKHSPSKEIVLFRGQSVDKPLLPKYARTVMTALGDGEIKEEEILSVEKSRFTEFSRRVGQLMEKSPTNDWDLLGLAQHHGMETRLLDWTENPLVALYFAFENSLRHDTESILWLLSVPRHEIVMPSLGSSPFNTNRTRVFRPTIVSPRMAAQSGWFTVHAYLDKAHRFLPLDSNTAYKDLLGKMNLQLSPDAVMRFLNRIGINALSLFPDLDGLGKYINRSSDFSYSNWEFMEHPRRIGEPAPSTSWQKTLTAKKLIIIKRKLNRRLLINKLLINKPASDTGATA